MWLTDLPADIVLLAGTRSTLCAYHPWLIAQAAYVLPGFVRVIDGDHVIDPCMVARVHLHHHHASTYAVDRTPIHRCMTIDEWDAALTDDLDAHLHATGASLVLAAPFDTQILHSDVPDWEREAYLDWFLRSARSLAKQHDVPILWSLDLNRFSHAAPLLAARILQAVPRRRHVEFVLGGWRITDEGGAVLGQPVVPQRRLEDWNPVPVSVDAHV